MQGTTHAEEFSRHLRERHLSVVLDVCKGPGIAAAEELGDAETARICTGILKEEQAMAGWLEQRLPDLTREFLRREGAG